MGSKHNKVAPMQVHPFLHKHARQAWQPPDLCTHGHHIPFLAKSGADKGIGTFPTMQD